MRLATAAAFFLLSCSSASLARQQDQTLTGDLSGTYTATQTITAHDATVRAGTGATFRAGQAVRLEAGFKAELGATFRAEVDASLVGGGTCDLATLDLPPTVLNARFFPLNVAPVRHPSLSLNGFDCEESPTGCGSGLGLKQILEEVSDGDVDASLAAPYEDLRTLAAAGPYYPAPQDRPETQDNTQRMQALAFEALASYVLERNGCDVADFGLRDHVTAAQDLREVLLNGDAWRIVKGYVNDGVKWPWLLGNAARTLDLYLALENAYEHYGHHVTT